VLAEDQALGYVQITSFTGRTPDELRTALADLQASGVHGLVLDLRNNTGGLLQESIQVANAFVDSGTLVYEVDKRGERSFEAQADASLTDLPLVVLVNGLTASGAELVAGAIQDDQRGILIGQKTYGKGTVQQIFPLSDESSLHVTSAEWLTPGRHALDTVGLTPDIAMIPDAQGRDVELGEAVRHLERVLANGEAALEVTADAAERVNMEGNDFGG
jgi:carboxyl-terminal processing protease